MRAILKYRAIQGESALSIVELLTYLFLASLILAISIPSAFRPSTHKQLQDEANRLMQAIEGAILESRQNESKVKLELTPQGYAFSADVASQLSALGYSLPDEIFILNTPDIITFHKSGVSSPATISLKKEDESCNVIISLRGRVKVLC